MAKHFRKECECGAVISQCKCISEHKTVETITHTEHLDRIHLRQEADGAELTEQIPDMVIEEGPVEELLKNIDDENIPITLDFQDNLSGLLGYFVPPNINPQMKMIANMMAAGYTFEIAPTTLDGKLIGVSVISRTMRKSEERKFESESN